MIRKTTPYSEWFNVYYGQNQEDLILRSLFPDVTEGFYVDVGAHDPDRFSVTKLFYNLGWHGINIEPQPTFYKKMLKARKRDINLNLAAGKKKDKLLLREYPDASGLSTLSRSMAQSYPDDARLNKVTKRFKEYLVDVDTMESILDTYTKGTIHFMKIDVEVFEHEVLEGMDWMTHRPMVVCIEANHISNDWSSLLTDNGYTQFLFDGLNRYYVDDTVREGLLKSFDYARTALARIPVSGEVLDLFLHDINQVNREYTKLSKIVAKQDAYIKELQSDIYHLNGKFSHRLRKALLSRRHGKDDIHMKEGE